jgi:spermidine/putrescine transport system substrate-binding protein
MICFLLLTGCGSSKPQLNLFVWGEYFSPELIEQFEEEHDCQVVIDTFETNEAMYAKLKLGAAGYDIVMPSNYIVETMVEQGMLRLINIPDLKNIDFIDRREAERIGIPIGPYGIPYMISYSGLGCRKERIEDFKPSWTLFGRSSLRGRMTMLGDMREAMGASLITLGYSVNTDDPDEIDRAVELLLKWKKNLAKFESEQFKNGLASAEYLVVQGYNTDILQVIIEEPSVSFVYPEEGSPFSIDCLAIPATSKNPELALAFIDFFLRPDIAARNMNFSLTANLVAVDRDHLIETLRNSGILNPPESLREKAQLIKNLGETLRLYSEAWERVLTE